MKCEIRSREMMYSTEAEGALNFRLLAGQPGVPSVEAPGGSFCNRGALETP
jgi:hypothetical protein